MFRARFVLTVLLLTGGILSAAPGTLHAQKKSHDLIDRKSVV